MSSPPTIDALLNLVPDNPASVLAHLRAHPHLALLVDAHGYSLLHAAVSYDHADLARALIAEFHVDPNILDEDGETCLFNVESVEMARVVVDELRVDVRVKNAEGLTAEEKLDDEDEQPAVAEFLRNLATQKGHGDGGVNGVSMRDGENARGDQRTMEDGESLTLPALPPGVHINLGTMSSAEAGDAPDPELRRRIEELAAREDFASAATQQELRELISDALSSVREESQGVAPPATRRRVD